MKFEINKHVKIINNSINIIFFDSEKEKYNYISSNSIDESDYYDLYNCLILINKSRSNKYTSLLKIDHLLILMNPIKNILEVYTINYNSGPTLIDLPPLFEELKEAFRYLEANNLNKFYRKIVDFYGEYLTRRLNLDAYKGVYSLNYTIDTELSRYYAKYIDDSVEDLISNDENLEFIKKLVKLLL